MCAVLGIGGIGWGQITEYPDNYTHYRERIGFNQLKAELGAAMPTGAGVGLSHVEAFSGGNYTPGATTSGTGTYAGKTFTAKSGNSGQSGHASAVARFLYGDLTVSPGITTIDVWSASDWYFSSTGHVRPYTNQQPSVETNKVSSHSWVGSATADQRALRKLDHAIDRDDYTALVGAPSSGNVRANLGASYNAVVVGRSDIVHGEINGTVIGGEGNGRVKPDIVAPERITSSTTPIVASVAALLWQTVQDRAELAEARHAETIKAALLGGATKDEFANWSRTPTKPLAETWGAGEVNVYRSYHILDAGRQLPGSDVEPMGWDFNQTTTAAPQTYTFDVARGTVLDDLSILLTWHRKFAPDEDLGWAEPVPSLANLDLKLYELDESGQLGALVDHSISAIDNVEHIFLKDGLDSGRYALQILSDAAGTDYSLAWYSNAIPEPGMMGMMALAGALLLRRRTLVDGELL